MEIKENMCYSHLLAILMDTQGMTSCVQSVNFTAPDLTLEGANGFMETQVVFHINPFKLTEFSEMYNRERGNVDDKFYHMVRTGVLMDRIEK